MARRTNEDRNKNEGESASGEAHVCVIRRCIACDKPASSRPLIFRSLCSGRGVMLRTTDRSTQVPSGMRATKNLNHRGFQRVVQMMVLVPASIALYKSMLV